jgi:hypothetical protein
MIVLRADLVRRIDGMPIHFSCHRRKVGNSIDGTDDSEGYGILMWVCMRSQLIHGTHRGLITCYYVERSPTIVTVAFSCQHQTELQGNL